MYGMKAVDSTPPPSYLQGSEVGKVKVLGKINSNGAFSAIFMGELINYNPRVPVVIKKLKNDAYLAKYNHREIQALKTLSENKKKDGIDPNTFPLLHLLDACYDNSSTYLIMEYCNGGNLEEYRRKKQRALVMKDAQVLSEQEARYVMQSIVKGYDYMYTRCKYLHRDLKPENIFIMDPTGRLAKMQQVNEDYLINNNCIIKIGDFGFSRPIDKSAETEELQRMQQITIAQNYQQRQANIMETNNIGTPIFMSPEMHQKPTGHSQRSGADIWALGIIMYILLFGKMPFEASNYRDLKEHISDGNYQVCLNLRGQHPYSIEFYDLLEQMVQADQQQRIKIAQVVAHDFINDGKKLHPLDPVFKRKDPFLFCAQEKVFRDFIFLYLDKNQANLEVLDKYADESPYIEQMFFEQQ